MHDQTKGMILMLIAVLIIPITDGIAKYLTSYISVLQIVWLRSILQAIILGLVIYFGRKSFSKFESIYIYLGLTLSACMFFLFWGLEFLPMANNIALFFVEPFILTILSVIFLKEKFTKAILITLIIGFIGTLVVIRPNWSAYGIAAVYPILAGFFYALYLLILRISSNQNKGVIQTQFYIGLVSTVIFSLIMFFGLFSDIKVIEVSTVNFDLWGYVLALGVITSIAHYIIAKAFSYAKPSVLASFQYVEIVSATILGAIFFSELPDTLTVIGACIVVIAGLNLIYFERKVTHKE